MMIVSRFKKDFTQKNKKLKDFKVVSNFLKNVKKRRRGVPAFSLKGQGHIKMVFSL